MIHDKIFIGVYNTLVCVINQINDKLYTIVVNCIDCVLLTYYLILKAKNTNFNASNLFFSTILANISYKMQIKVKKLIKSTHLDTGVTFIIFLKTGCYFT